MLELMFGIVFGLLVLAIPVVFIVCLIMACIRKKPVWWVLTGVSALLGLLLVIPVLFVAARAWKHGADRAEAMLRERAAMEALLDGGDSSEIRKVVCMNGVASLRIPAVWTDLMGQMETEDASLFVGTLERMRYCMLVSEPREAFVEFFGEEVPPFEKFNAIVRNQTVEALEDGEAAPTRRVELPHAPIASYTSIRGTGDGYEMEYCLYTMETPGHFHQLIMWTADPAAGDAAPLFEAVAKSFELVAAGTPED